ncbi:hypothetical protein BP6252_07096 [Coleophoma cylindrospora]|uniref:Bromo domain-containing protein n=1 Tax=Coleophoma cylindrospora TaxID=1849047 RepID=A0A3D8RGL2_9HELO|nr:hypothetical protein BP6252_07096 [Coleophoma cylindrospora]
MEPKRKVSGGGGSAPEELDNRAAKRRRLPTDSNTTNEQTAVTTTKHGLAFLEQVKAITDKSGRLVADDFLILPDENELPDYYEVIKMPIALDTMEQKLKNHEFLNLTSFESYFKRMIQNARDYNERGSQIVNDAERLQKALIVYMKEHNPAYKTAGFSSHPTPIPEDDSAAASEVDADEESEPDVATLKRRGRPPKTQKTPARVEKVRKSSSTPAAVDKYIGVSYSGLTFQEAQEKLIGDIIAYKEDPEDSYRYFEVFVNLPPKTLKDYYQKIPNPMSLRQISMRIIGNRGRGGSTGVSDFKNWAALEEDLGLIWKNAMFYNEDGSEIYNLAAELEASYTILSRQWQTN